jgi:hypothetical protein
MIILWLWPVMDRKGWAEWDSTKTEERLWEYIANRDG